MTSNEILKADVLDILFENRNKQYGAYALRKYYNNRMYIALGTSMAAVLLTCLLIRPGGTVVSLSEAEDDNTVVISQFIPIEPPIEQPAPPTAAKAKPIASQAYLNRIEIVAEVDPQDKVPELDDLANRQIASFTQDGRVPLDNRTVETQLQEKQGAGSAPVEPTEGFAPVERLPEFPGGAGAWSAFLGRHLSVPDELGAGERRTVQVRFWVGEDGSVTRLEVVQSAGAAFDNEVIRVLKKMPKWKPAIQNGHPVAVTFTQPVTFQALEE